MFTPYKYVIPHVVCLIAVHDRVMQRSYLECTFGIVDLATTGNLRRLQLLHLRLNASRAVCIRTLIFRLNFYQTFFIQRGTYFIIFPLFVEMGKNFKIFLILLLLLLLLLEGFSLLCAMSKYA
jgi:hypothetical protein